MTPGWLYLCFFEQCKDKILGICSDWRRSPPSIDAFTIDMIQAEIIAEALTLIDITVDPESFVNNTPYQTYIDEIFSRNMEQEW